MSNLMDGLSNIYSLTDKINALKDQKKAGITAGNTPGQVDPQTALLELQKDFNDMLNSLMTDSSDEEKKKQGNDPFAGFMTNNQAPTNNPAPNTLNLDNLF